MADKEKADANAQHPVKSADEVKIVSGEAAPVGPPDAAAQDRNDPNDLMYVPAPHIAVRVEAEEGEPHTVLLPQKGDQQGV